jgi:hypothetical protein
MYRTHADVGIWFVYRLYQIVSVCLLRYVMLGEMAGAVRIVSL